MSQHNDNASRAAIAIIAEHEGCSLTPYPDTRGYTTIGYGHCIDPRVGGGITQQQANYLLQTDADTKIKRLRENIEFWHELPDFARVVLIDMAYQMGVTDVLQFRRTLVYMEDGNWHRAAKELLNSDYASDQQTRERARENSQRLANQKIYIGENGDEK